MQVVFVYKLIATATLYQQLYNTFYYIYSIQYVVYYICIKSKKHSSSKQLSGTT